LHFTDKRLFSLGFPLSEPLLMPRIPLRIVAFDLARILVRKTSPELFDNQFTSSTTLSPALGDTPQQRVKPIHGALADVVVLRATVQPCQTVASSHQHLTLPTGTCHIEHKHLIFLDLGALTGRRLKLSGCLRCRVAAPCPTPRNSL